MFSGPVGGIVATRALAARMGWPRAVALDMGGTSTDLCLIGPDLPNAKTQVGGMPLALPTEDLHTIGCGGGSIAWVDAGGALRVGPHSAGADPGPACYGKGDEPTVTDAHVVLGNIGGDTLLGGRMAIDTDRSVRAVERLAKACGLSVRNTAEGILEIAETNIMRAVLRITAQRGIDPSQLPLVAYGGAGGLHAAGIARRLRMPAAIVPQHPGAFSAVSLAVAGESQEVLQPFHQPLSAIRAAELVAQSKQLTTLARESLGTDKCQMTVTTRLRFHGQGESLEVPFHADLAASFERRHQELFGFVPEHREIELVEMRARAMVSTRTLPASRFGRGGSARQASRKPLVSGEARAVWQRDELSKQQGIRGPALIEERTGATFVSAFQRVTADAGGLLIHPLDK